MKKLLATLLIATVGSIAYNNAQVYLFKEFADPISNSYESNLQDQTVDNSGNIIVAYSDSNDSYTLKVKFKDTDDKRHILGPGSLPTAEGYTPSIAADSNNNYYVAYSDESSGIKGHSSIIKRNGSTRSYLGGQGYSNNWTYYHSITVDNNNTPYVLFTDYGTPEQLIVQRRTGAIRETIGSGDDFTIPYTTNDDYGIDQFIKTAPNGNLYVGYISSDNKNLVFYYRDGSNWNSTQTLNINDFNANYTINSMDFTISDTGELYALVWAKQNWLTQYSSIITYKLNGWTREVIDDSTTSARFGNTVTHRANSIVLEKTTNYPIISYLSIATSLQINGETSYVKKRNGTGREIEDQESHWGLNYVLWSYDQILSIDPLWNIHRTERGNSADGFQYSKLILAYKTYFKNFSSNYRYSVQWDIPKEHENPTDGMPNLPLNTPIKLYIWVANDFAGKKVTSPIGNIKMPVSTILGNKVIVNTKFFKQPE